MEDKNPEVNTERVENEGTSCFQVVFGLEIRCLHVANFMQ